MSPGVFSTVVKVLDRIENWLVSLFELGEQERDDAGIHFDDTYHP